MQYTGKGNNTEPRPALTYINPHSHAYYMGAAITTSHLTKDFRHVTAVDTINLTIPEGELFGLIGPNGAGKTTLIKLLTGQLQPDGGRASVAGVDPATDPVQVRAQVGIIPEQETPPSFLTAEEYLQFVCRIRGIPADTTPDISKKWLNFFDCIDERHVLCKDLSRGTRQKLMVSQAFLHQPPVAFIDEPLINLDPLMQRKLKTYLKDFVNNNGTLVLSTHVLEIAQEICTTFGILQNGQLRHHGTLEGLDNSLSDTFMELIDTPKDTGEA